MLIILDTSVIISLLLTRAENHTRTIIRAARTNKLQLAVSFDTFSELQKTIQSEKIKKLTNYRPAAWGIFMAWYKYHAVYYSISAVTRTQRTSRDKNDDKYLHLAQISKAQYIISLDNDLLVLKNSEKTQIVTPSQFVSQELVRSN